MRRRWRRPSTSPSSSATSASRTPRPAFAPSPAPSSRTGTAPPRCCRSELREFLDGVAQALAQRHGAAWPGGTTTNTLSSRSGAMVQSIVESVEVNGTTFDKITGQIGGSMIAAVQEFGATITPKTAKYLTVPLPAALDSQGHPEKEERPGVGQHLRRPVEGRQPDHFPARRREDHPALRAEEQRHHPAEARHAEDARRRHSVFRRAGDGRACP